MTVNTAVHDGYECKSIDDHCYAHNVDEPVTAGTFRVCGECRHAFQTQADLVAADQKSLGEEARDPSAIYSCPVCAHDF